MLNTLILQARFVEDPELKHTDSGSAVTHPRIAWSTKFKDKETKLFLNCSAWGHLAEFICNYFKKGDMAIVSGRLITRTYEKDNETKYVNELVLEKCFFAGSKKDSKESNVSAPKDNNFSEEERKKIVSDYFEQGEFDMNNTEDLPF